MGIAAITLHFSIRLGIDLYSYLSLKKSSAARISQWEIVELKGRYALKAEYLFEAQGKNWPGSFILSPPYYLNEAAALSALKEKAKEPFRAWYQPKNPPTSALEKNFPKSLMFRTILCGVVLIYFLFLKRKFIKTQ